MFRYLTNLIKYRLLGIAMLLDMIRIGSEIRGDKTRKDSTNLKLTNLHL